MTQHERLSLRQTHCGSFEAALISAWFKADMINKNILEEAFKNRQDTQNDPKMTPQALQS